MEFPISVKFLDKDLEDLLDEPSEPRFHIPQVKPKWDGAEDWGPDPEEDDDTALVQMIQDYGICVIEEPVTCCDDPIVPEVDFTQYYDRLVDDPVEHIELIKTDEKSGWSDVSLLEDNLNKV